jgi:hypothetical protein
MKATFIRIAAGAAGLALATAGFAGTALPRALAATATPGGSSNNCSMGNNTSPTFNFRWFNFFMGSPVGQNCSGSGANGGSA